MLVLVLVRLVIGWLRAMAITEEEKQLREAVRASLLTAASERRSTAGAVRRNLQQLADAVADSLAEAERRSWEESQEYANLEAATRESALEEVRRRQVQEHR